MGYTEHYFLSTNKSNVPYVSLVCARFSRAWSPRDGTGARAVLVSDGLPKVNLGVLLEAHMD